MKKEGIRKIVALGLTGLLALGLTACGGAAGNTAGAGAGDTVAEATGETAEASASEAASETAEASAEGTKEAKGGTATDGAGTGTAGGGTFTVGFDQDFPPMGFIGDDGEFTGFDLELAAEAAKRMGKEVVYQPIAWDSKDAELDAGTIDCIWNGFTISGREDSYTWSDPYMDNTQVFVVRKDSDIKTSADLKGKTVEVQVDSSAQAALNEDENKDLSASFGTLQTSPDYDTALMDLDMGSVDAIAMDSTVAEYKITKGGMALRVLDEPFASETYGIGFKKGNEALRDEVNKVMKEMAADGTLKSISEKWFGKDVTTIK
ncbi:MAG: amino acid ABC transporter substrate-binding protein [Lachnospiraceae bacterium]|nr:amino acid ABC transporter substrate-binding protein [Lachnospiraceae bacterium]